MNTIPVPSITIFEQYGLAVYLALFFSIGIFIAAISLVWWIMKTNKEERKDSQQLLKETIGSHTRAITQATASLHELGSLMKFHLESTGRLEEGHKRQRDEHQAVIDAVRGGNNILNNTLVQTKADIGTLHHDIEEIKEKTETTLGKVFDIDRNVENLG